MSTAPALKQLEGIPKGQLWTGRVLSGLVSALLLLDAIMKLMRPEEMMKEYVRSGWPADTALTVGVILLTCTGIYLIPRTAILGAVLLTGYLGGAVATNLRLHNPLFTYTLVPIYVGIFIWGGLLLRDRRLRTLV